MVLYILIFAFFDIRWEDSMFWTEWSLSFINNPKYKQKPALI
jgi:hypothetical protein